MEWKTPSMALVTARFLKNEVIGRTAGRTFVVLIIVKANNNSLRRAVNSDRK